MDNKEFHINADDEVEYVSEKAISYAEEHNFFEDMIDVEESFKRRHTCKRNESRFPKRCTLRKF